MRKVINIKFNETGKLWYVLLALILCVISAATAQAVPALNVQGVNKSGPPTAVSNYRWLIEEDATYHVQRDPLTGEVELSGGFPVIDPNWYHRDAAGNPYPLSLSFHRSYMPVVAKGDENTDFPGVCNGATFPCLDPAKHYYVSVLPKSPGTYGIGGAQFKGSDTGDVTVYLNQQPIPTAQITIFVFKDTQPINNAPDATEVGLGGFQIQLEDAGGRYGASAGAQSQDAFGNPLGTQYDAAGNVTGYQPLVTGPDGTITIKNLAPGKYGVLAVPPIGSNWQQTSTIEGTKVIDAWVKANEPPFFAEFGPPGYHVFIGFVQPFNDIPPPANPGDATATITGDVVNLHLSRPPYTGGAFNLGGPFTHTTPWVGLNDNAGLAGVSNGIYAARTVDGHFEIPNVPAGNYQLVVWDDNLDLVFAFQGVTVNPDGTTCGLLGDCNLSEVGVFQWFTRLEHRVFSDLNGNGIWNANEPGLPPLPEQAVNLRWRDGTLYQTAPTDGEGFVPFDQTFPFFAWQTAEVDFLRFKATGLTVIVDDGGPVDLNDPWTFGGLLNPQPQGNPADPDSVFTSSKLRVENGPVLVEGFQGFLGQTSVMMWGKKAYTFNETGGISGIVYYAVTRAEDNPRFAAVEPWEPGIPRVQVNLYKDADGDGAIDDLDGNGIQLADVDNYPFDWSTGGTMGLEDIDNSVPPNGVFDQGDAIQVTWTDSWDDNLPANCQYGVTGAAYSFRGQVTDCYDGMRNWNQVRPAVFDGGYAFGPEYSISGDFGGVAPDWITVPDPAKPDLGVIKSGVYIVEAKAPPGYEIVKEEDRNVDFGDEYIPSPALPPPVCVGDIREVPPLFSFLSDETGAPFPGVDPTDPDNQAPFAGQDRKLCDRKQIFLNPGQNGAVDFFLFTHVPIAGHIVGGILDDTANEFDPASPQFGEKFAPPFMPIAIQDWTGREIGRTYSDEYGRFNALVPSTYTANLPQPSGMSPNMLTTCMNHPGPILVNGVLKQDPLFNPQYSTFCYTFQYMPGATTYLDTPVVPSAAFAGPDQFPLDCEFPDGTPRISMASVGGGGPFIANPTVANQITITSMGSVVVPNPLYEGTGGGTNKTITRDYGFGNGIGSVQLVEADGTEHLLTVNPANWTNASITATVPPGLPSGANGALQLTVTRSNGRSTVTGLTVQVGLRPASNLLTVSPGTPDALGRGPIQQAIDAAGANDLILVRPGTYDEMVIMWKPVQLQGWGPGAVTINAVNTPMEKLQYWRNKVEQLVTNGDVDLLPGQAAGFGGVEPGTLFTEEGAGVIVLAKSTGPNRFIRNNNNWVNRGARIDGFTIRGASTGGGIVVNGFGDYLEIGNNIILNNSGFYGGGIRLGHPEMIGPDEQYVDASNDWVRIHHNQITQNGGLGGAGGGVSLCTGSDNYRVNANWICGNFTLGDGAGIGHLGYSNNGEVEGNQILFNEQFNQGLSVSGGGIFIGGQTPLVAGGLSPGSGNVDIVGNVILGNSAGVGDGGGIRLSQTNGQDVNGSPGSWRGIDIFNNMIANNVAALAGGGISLQDAAKARIAHNVVANNDSTASAANAFTPGSFTSDPQPAGIVARAHSPALRSAITAACGTSTNQYCDSDKPNPQLQDNIIWHNRSFFVEPSNGQPGAPLILSPAANPYDDLAVLGTATPQYLDPRFNILTDRAEDTPHLYFNNNQDENPATVESPTTLSPAVPAFVRAYLNGGIGTTILPGEPTTLIQIPAAVDEGGNFIRVRFGPLHLCNDAVPGNGDPGLCSDYHITPGSSARNADPRANPAPSNWAPIDIDGEPRPFGARSDFGADELQQ